VAVDESGVGVAGCGVRVAEAPPAPQDRGPAVLTELYDIYGIGNPKPEEFGRKGIELLDS
jgi:hypothetical protein